MKKLLISFFFFCYCLITSFGQNGYELKFNNKKEFKIVQFTDFHWSSKSSTNPETENIISEIIRKENPDIVILTGDIVTNFSAKEGWDSIAKIFEKAKLPWTITLGNHDTEAGITREGIFDFLKNKPYFIGEKGPQLTGCGNYTIPIKNAKGTEVAAILYCLDSNNKPMTHKYGHYDWIHFDQIEWYCKTSEYYKSLNNRPIPALAFFHIPLPEYKKITEANSFVGNKKEGIASPEINSGLFSSMIEKEDVMGIFVGHDHNNDFIGIEQDIALAFGRVSGLDAYGELERGARIIVLYENAFRFDTWISTPTKKEFIYYFPSGINEEEEIKLQYLPASDIKVKQPGVAYTYYEGQAFKHSNDILKAQPVKKGIMNNISIDSATAQDSMAFIFETWIKINERGIYNFYTYSDDGSKLLIDNKIIVDNDGSHSLTRKDGKIGLEAGYHKLKVLYFEDYMGEMLEVGFSGKNIRENTIPHNILFLSDE